MTDNLPGIEEATQLATSEEPQLQVGSKRQAMLFSAGIFVLALAAALLQNTRRPAHDVAMLFDSGAYIMSAKYVLTAFHNFAHGMAFDAAVKSVGETLMLNGPVLPGLGAIYFGSIAREPSLIDMRAPIVLQAILHAISASMLALVGWRFTGGRAIGLSAGILLAVWPSAVIGAGRFLTETISTLFISAVMLSASHLARERKESQLRLSSPAAFIFGATAALLALTKAALAPGVVLTVAAIFLLLLLSKVEKRSFIAALLSSIVGVFLVLAPWLMFTKIASGEFCLTPKRLPTLNMSAGLNPETDGLSALPETPMVTMYSENDGPSAVAYALYTLNPGDFYGRMARKPLRLFQYPWNDCRLDFLGIPVIVQVIAHQILVVFGFFGLLAFVSLPLSFAQRKTTAPSTLNETPADNAMLGEQPHPELNRASLVFSDTSMTNPATAEPQVINSLIIGMASLAIVCGHFAYLPFVADARYGFTAMPSLILLGMWCISGQLKQRISKTSLIRLGIAATFIIVAFSLRDDVWRSLFATSTEAMIASTVSLGALLLFIGCLMAVRTLLGAGKSNATAKVLAFTASYLALTIVLAASMMGKESPYDWESRLADGQELVRIVELPKSASFETAYVLVNLKGDWRSAHLKVNNQTVDAVPVSLLHLTGNPILSNDYRTFGYILKTGTDGIDQWRAFSIPPELLKPGAQNTISIYSQKGETAFASLTGSTIFGDSKKQPNTSDTYAPSIGIFSPTNLCRMPLLSEPRLREKMPKSVARAACVRKVEGSVSQDLSETPGTQFGQYHLFLLAGSGDKFGSREKKESTPSIQVKAFNPIYVNVKAEPVQTRGGVKPEDNASTYNGGCLLPENGFAAPYLRVTLTGEIDCASKVSCKISLDDLRLMQAPVDLACSPARIDGAGKRKFRTQAIALASTVDPKSALAMIKISSDLVPLSVSNLRLELQPFSAPELNLSRKSWF